jgi:CheY-like chemotaxis protein
VTDTGRGIPADSLDRLFTPFERLDAAQTGIEGTGLGLALSRQLVESMDGRMGVVSRVGAGSTFWFDLPAAARVTVAAEPDRGCDPIMAGRSYPAARQVLYVEDVPDNPRLVQEILTRRPQIELNSTALGRGALDLAREHRPDLILLDLNLPDIHGRDLLGQLTADPRTQDIPVVILSADATPGQIERLHAAGACCRNLRRIPLVSSHPPGGVSNSDLPASTITGEHCEFSWAGKSGHAAAGQCAVSYRPLGEPEGQRKGLDVCWIERGLALHGLLFELFPMGCGDHAAGRS